MFLGHKIIFYCQFHLLKLKVEVTALDALQNTLKRKELVSLIIFKGSLNDYEAQTFVCICFHLILTGFNHMNKPVVCSHPMSVTNMGCAAACFGQCTLAKEILNLKELEGYIKENQTCPCNIQHASLSRLFTWCFKLGSLPPVVVVP